MSFQKIEGVFFPVFKFDMTFFGHFFHVGVWFRDFIDCDICIFEFVISDISYIETVSFCRLNKDRRTCLHNLYCELHRV